MQLLLPLPSYIRIFSVTCCCKSHWQHCHKQWTFWPGDTIKCALSVTCIYWSHWQSCHKQWIWQTRESIMCTDMLGEMVDVFDRSCSIIIPTCTGVAQSLIHSHSASPAATPITCYYLLLHNSQAVLHTNFLNHIPDQCLPLPLTFGGKYCTACHSGYQCPIHCPWPTILHCTSHSRITPYSLSQCSAHNSISEQHTNLLPCSPAQAGAYHCAAQLVGTAQFHSKLQQQHYLAEPQTNSTPTHSFSVHHHQHTSIYRLLPGTTTLPSCTVHLAMCSSAIA